MTIADRDELRRPPYDEARGTAWLLAELRDHLWPWRAGHRPARSSLHLAGIAVALAASIAWVMAAVGQLSAGAIIGWWFGWSMLEVLVRLDGKPYVKEGPWWGRIYRRASPMDMLCYVCFKNLLIGASLFLGLKSLGLLQL